MNSSSIADNELLKVNKTKKDTASDISILEVKDEFEDAEGFGNPDAYHK